MVLNTVLLTNIEIPSSPYDFKESLRQQFFVYVPQCVRTQKTIK